MVVWIYAGGGHTEAEGLVPFFEAHLQNCTFERQMPSRRRPGPDPNTIVYPGQTGKSLAAEIRKRIREYWEDGVDIILVIDDADDANPAEREALFRSAVTESLQERGVTSFPKTIIALAVPEIETWPLADWDNTFAKRYGNCHSKVRHELSAKINFREPESFQTKDDKGIYANKLSAIVADCINRNCNLPVPYSKAKDTPRLLRLANPVTVSRKCPYFKKFWTELSKLCGPSKGARA